MRQSRLTDLNEAQGNVTMTPWSSSHEGGHNDSSFCEECKLTPFMDWADNQHNLSEWVHKLTSMRQRRLTTTWEKCNLAPFMDWVDNLTNLSEGVTQTLLNETKEVI